MPETSVLDNQKIENTPNIGLDIYNNDNIERASESNRNFIEKGSYRFSPNNMLNRILRDKSDSAK